MRRDIGARLCGVHLYRRPVTRLDQEDEECSQCRIEELEDAIEKCEYCQEYILEIEKAEEEIKILEDESSDLKERILELELKSLESL